MSTTTAQLFQGRVTSWRERGEVFWGAVVTYNRKEVYRVDERPSSFAARADVNDWAVRMGKVVQWEDGTITRRTVEKEAVVLETVEVRDQRSEVSTLSETEALRLGELEGRVTRGIDGFLEVGQALIEIRERRLWRERYRTFEEYCRLRWDFTGRRARQLMAAAEVVQNLGECRVQSGEGGPDLAPGEPHAEGPIRSEATPARLPLPLPERESQARALFKLPPSQQQEAWKEAVKSAPGGQVTARHVEAAVERRLKPKGNEDRNNCSALELRLEGETVARNEKADRRRAILVQAGDIVARLGALEQMVGDERDKGSLGYVRGARSQVEVVLRKYSPKPSKAVRARLGAIARARWLKAKAAGVNSLAGRKKRSRSPKPSAAAVADSASRRRVTDTTLRTVTISTL